MKHQKVVYSQLIILVALSVVCGCGSMRVAIGQSRAKTLQAQVEKHAYIDGKWDVERLTAFVLSHPDCQRRIRINKNEVLVGSEIMLFRFYIDESVPQEVRDRLDVWIAQNESALAYDQWRASKRTGESKIK